MSLLDRCIFRPVASGTADFVVSTAVTGFQTPAQANAVNGATYSYAAQTVDGSGFILQWEVGQGTYTVGTTTLARTTIIFSSNANAKVNFSQVPQVLVTALQEDIIQTLALTGDVTGSVTASSSTSMSTTIANNAVTTVKIIDNAVTNAKLAQATSNTLKGNPTGATANITDTSRPVLGNSGGTGGQVTLNSSTSGSATLSVQATGGASLTSGSSVSINTLSISDTVAGGSVRTINQNGSSANNSISGLEVSLNIANTFGLFDLNSQTAAPLLSIGWGSGVTQGLSLLNNGTQAVNVNNGMQVGAAPTGGDKGAGTVNASGGFFVNGNSNPTVQRFTSGSSLTYTAPASLARIKVRMVGGGGGGGGASANNGANGVDSSFGTWTAVHGNGGNANVSQFAAGGTGGTNGTGTLVVRIPGGSGGGNFINNTTANLFLAFGGGTPFAQGGFNNLNNTGGTVPINGIANTGAGGAGGATTAPACGSGGGGGEYVEFWMTSSQVGASQTYTVGGGGNGGAAGGQAGGNGAAGVIIVEEFYI